MSSTLVETSYGKLKGIKKISSYDGTEYTSFQGIPYAKPPVGLFRFKDPQPLESWKDIKEVIHVGNRAPHRDNMFTNAYTGDEDCLYLNIYVPQIHSSSALIPVMFWIHGGSFVVGHGEPCLYGPEYLMGKNVILVTINYRLGVLGFLNLESPDASGNMGLKDQSAALKWISNEIINFGGDPKNITLFGESAGAASVHLHMLSPLSKGLFHKAILQSGSALCNWGFTKNHLQRAFDLGKLLGCDTKDKTELLTFLKTVPPKTFIRLQDEVMTREEHLEGVDQAFVPTVDRSFLLEDPLELIKKGNTYDVPTIVGVVSHEGLLIHCSVKAWPWFVDLFNQKLECVIPSPLKKSVQMAKKIRENYFNGDQKICFKNHNSEFVELYTHTMYVLPILMHLKYELSHSSRTSPIYFYRFSYDGGLGWFRQFLELKKKINLPKGVSHIDELGYLLSNCVIEDKIQIEGSDRDMLENMTSYWTNFAKTGNPNFSTSNENETWHHITNVNELILFEISNPTKVEMKKIFDNTNKVNFWIDQF